MPYNTFFRGKNKGMNREMRGNIGCCYIFVNDPDYQWTEKDQEPYISTFRNASDFFQAEASRYKTGLSVRNFVFSASAAKKVSIKSNTKQWVADVFSSMKYRNINDLRTKMMQKHHLDDVCVIFVFPYYGISFAHRQTSGDGAAEYAVFMGLHGFGNIVHEICHLYGAEDYYYTDEVKEYVRRYFGKSVMDVTTDHVIDDLTAYNIGWAETLSSSALAFLAAAASISPEEWDACGLEAIKTKREKEYHESDKSYVGEKKDGMRHGYGILNLSNGDRYEGEFARNTFHGKGTYYHKNGAVTRGFFQNGHCILCVI